MNLNLNKAINRIRPGNPTFSSRWTDITKDNKNDRETRKEHNINLNRPNIPNFDDDPARNDDIDVFTSQCTSGDR